MHFILFILYFPLIICIITSNYFVTNKKHYYLLHLLKLLHLPRARWYLDTHLRYPNARLNSSINLDGKLYMRVATTVETIVLLVLGVAISAYRYRDALKQYTSISIFVFLERRSSSSAPFLSTILSAAGDCRVKYGL